VDTECVQVWTQSDMNIQTGTGVDTESDMNIQTGTGVDTESVQVWTQRVYRCEHRE
jgi:hypothetical protein